jgi:hypothetical protein
MYKDQLLQEKLAEMESGKPVDQVLQNLPDGMADLKEMIMLVSDIQQSKQPSLSPDARKHFTTIRKNMKTQKSTKIPKWEWALLGTVTALLIIVTITAGVLILRTVQPASAASLDNIQGVVGIKTVNGDWNVGVNNTQIKEGTTLRTYSDSTADLHLPDGSVINMDADTLISIDKFSWNRNGTLEFLVSTQSGGITNTVVPLNGSSSYYHVRTPGGLVTVHGTEFQVYALDNKQSIVNVVHGNVQVDNQSGSVDLTTGQMTLASTTNSPSKPIYSFNYDGSISSKTSNSITLDGTEIKLTGDTKAVNSPILNANVHVIGHFDADGNQVADLIVPGNGKNDHKMFTGTVSAINDTIWTIGSSTVTVLPGTKVNGSPVTGSVVKVWFSVAADGTWQADKIVNTSDEADIEAAEETTTPSPTVVETPTVTDGTTTPTLPAGTSTPGPRTNGICGSDTQQPEAVTLAERYGTTYEVIMGWFCRNNGFGEIDLAYQLSAEFGKPVEEVFAMRETGLGWGQIRHELEGNGKPTKQPKVENTRKPH